MTYDIESGIVRQILDDAGAILACGSAWCKKNNAVDENNKPIPIFSPLAKKYDIYGACVLAHRRSGETHFGSLQYIFKYLKNCIPDTYKSKDIEAYNDDIDWKKVEEILQITSCAVSYTRVRATDDGSIRITDDGKVLSIG